uniref:Zinc finger protein 85-like n=1 Tax=Diabrotica virgifera virgifera TaxID=50390 RepID=A0A6P7GM14_DIAVI
MKTMETLTAHSTHTGNYRGRHAEGKPLNKNMEVVTGRRSYKCETCFKKFTQACNLNLHLRVHTGERPYKCEICFKQFSRMDHLKRHLRVHTSEKPYKCEICFRQFSQTSSLKTHLRVHTGDGEQPYKCKICFKRFSEADNLKRHLRVHIGEKPCKCEEASEMISCKVETDNETFDGPLDAFKVEIKEEPKTEPAYDTFGYLDCNEFPLKTEVEQEQDECKFTPSETKQTANE